MFGVIISLYKSKLCLLISFNNCVSLLGRYILLIFGHIEKILYFNSITNFNFNAICSLLFSHFTYFPIQNFPKMLINISWLLISPVTSPKAFKARFMSNASISLVKRLLSPSTTMCRASRASFNAM